MRLRIEGGRARSAERAHGLSLSSLLLAIVVGVVSSLTFSAAFDMARAHSKSVIQMLPFTSAYSKTIWLPSGDQTG